MDLLKSILLWGSKNPFLCNKLPRYGFVKRAVKKFMPGEDIPAALSVAQEFRPYAIKNIFTHLGENIIDLSEADEVTRHYLTALDQIDESGLKISISLKLTQIGFDLSEEATLNNFKSIIEIAGNKNILVWIDMEDSSYTDQTINFYKTVKPEYHNTGICLQAYLLRTEADINNMLDIKPNIRLVKGAYLESPEIAFPKRRDVDENYFNLAIMMLDRLKEGSMTPTFATHDNQLLSHIADYAKVNNIKPEDFHVNMLYGIKSGLQKSLAKQGYDVAVLISYGEAWFPWYMRRLAERPANLWFVLKNMFRG